MSQRNKHGKIDETSNRYGRLTVLREAYSINRQATWTCRCDCGQEVIVRGYSLRRGGTKSCGCLHKEIIKKPNKLLTVNEIGNRHGRLVVISKADTKNGKCRWLCHCDCGKETIVAGNHLRGGSTKSCGCLQKELFAIRSSKMSGANHPLHTNGKRFGWSKKEQINFHEKIRKRDNYTCQKCDKTQEQEIANIGWKLSIHHKDGDHFNNEDENTVTLCQSCHMKIEAKITKTKRNVELLNMLDRIELGEFDDVVY